MEIEKLQKLGLSMNEAKLYLALIRLGEAQAGKISKEAQINRTTTYDSIERLIKKGLIYYSISANRRVFKPADPKEILNSLKEKQKTAEEIIPELNNLFKESKKKEEFNLYKGKKGIRSILNDILTHKEYVAFGSSGRFLEIMKHDFILFQKEKKEKKIKSRVILSNIARKTEQVKVAYSEFKFIPDKFTALTTTFVYGDKTAIIIWSENPTATLILGKEVSESYKNYFELLWRVAKK